MTNGLPVSRLVNVAVQLAPQAAQSPGVDTALLLGTSTVIDIVTRMRTYATLAEVAAAFGTSAPEYLAAALWFAQAPQPTSINIGRWAPDGSNGQLFGGLISAARQLASFWTQFGDASFRVTIDGGAPQNIVADLSGVSNMNGVASAITDELTGAVMTWDAVNQVFVLTSDTEGAASSVSYLSTSGAGTDISVYLEMQSGDEGAYQANGIAAESALEAVVIMDNRFSSQWYGLSVLEADDDDNLEIAEYIEAASTKHFYGITTDDAGCLIAGNTANIAYLLREEGYDRTAVQYSTETPYAVVSLLSRILTTNWDGNNTAITLMYKQEPSVAAEDLSTTQADALASFNANVFIGYNNDTAIIQYGTAASGEFIDTVIGIDWLAGEIQTNCFNLLYTSKTKIPQTDAGMNQLSAAIAQACQQAVTNGLLAPGIWTSAGFGQLQTNDFLNNGFYIYQPPVSSQSVQDRASRVSVPFQVAAKLAGAVHTVDVTIDVNP